MAISVVQAKAVTDSLSGSFSSPTTAGNAVIVAVCCEASTNVTMSVTGVTLGGSGGNFAQAAGSQSGYASGATQFAAIWADPSCAGGQTAIAASGTNLGGITGDNGIVIMEVSGLAASTSLAAVLDVTAAGSGTTGTAVSSGTTAATGQASEIWIAALSAFNVLSSPTAGWTVEGINDGGGEFNAAAYQVVSSTGTASFGMTQASGPWAGCVITLKAAVTVSAAGTLNGQGTLGGTGAFAGQVSLNGEGTISPAGTAIAPGAASLNGQGTIGGTADVLSPGAGFATLNGQGALSGTRAVTWAPGAALNGQGSIGGTVTGTWLQSGTLSGQGTLSETVHLGLTAGLAGAGALSIPQVSGGLVQAVGGAASPQALPGSSQVAVAPPGSSAWQWLGTLGHVTALTYSYACPGGADKMQCTVMVPASYRTAMFSPGWQVKITRGGHQVWYGKLDEPVPSPQGWTLTAVGNGNLGANFTAYYTDTWPAGEPDEAVNGAISRGLPWVNPGLNSSPYASQFWLGQGVDPAAQTVTALLNLVCTRGGLTWYVSSQPGGTYGGDNLSVFPLPTAVSRLLVCTTPVARTLGGYVNALYIRYQSSADNTTTNTAAAYGTTVAVNQPSITAHGRLEAYVDLADAGVMTAAQAQAVGASILQVYVAASFGGPFTVSRGQLLNTGGQAVDLGTDQAGTVARLVLTDMGYGGEVVPGPVQFLVGAYEYDDFTQTAQITPYQYMDQSLSGITQMLSTTMTPVTAAGG